MPRRNPWKEEAKRIAQEREREKDTIYYLDFVPKDGRPTGRTTLLDDPWCVRLFGNPRNRPEMIEKAVQEFEAKHGVESWQEVASSYEVNSLYYP